MICIYLWCVSGSSKPMYVNIWLDSLWLWRLIPPFPQFFQFIWAIQEWLEHGLIPNRKGYTFWPHLSRVVLVFCGIGGKSEWWRRNCVWVCSKAHVEICVGSSRICVQNGWIRGQDHNMCAKVPISLKHLQHLSEKAELYLLRITGVLYQRDVERTFMCYCSYVLLLCLCHLCL